MQYALFMKQNLKFGLVGQFRVHVFIVHFITCFSSIILDTKHKKCSKYDDVLFHKL
jgi:hypothetical protein